MDLSSEIQKTNDRITIRIQFSGKTDNFDFLGPNSPKNQFLVVNAGN